VPLYLYCGLRAARKIIARVDRTTRSANTKSVICSHIRPPISRKTNSIRGSQIYKSLPKMAKAANSDKLRAAFEKHEGETETQIERLEKIFEIIGKAARGKKCDAIEGILDEGKEIMEEYEGAPALDAGLLAAAQAVEHYEISCYGTLKTWANHLGLTQAVPDGSESGQDAA
jgi:hypothetical protein